MALLDEATEIAKLTGTTPDQGAVRQYRDRLGVSLDVEQSISSDLGVFARAGTAAGNVDEFSDIDRSVTIGGSIKGTTWRRAADTVGIAAIDNGISAERQAYLDAGGLGILVGDGKLPHPGAEQIIEAYYDFAARSWAHFTIDYQWVKNPAYNRDRGPVPILAARAHAQF
jgi:high affinity Mn2+ porin